ncbi:MAG TPA: cytochrome c [Stellaceae bacterium]|nr:cytochrome c [Stellaceae bacterium]
MRPEDRRFIRGLARSVLTAAIGTGLLAAASIPIASSWAQAEQKPYTVKDGKVDKGTYNGWRRYTEACLRCHGPDGAGSSYAPAMTDSLKQMSEDQFKEIVVNGRKNVTTSNENIMPPFGEVEDVMLYLDDIYAYLKARSDGVLGRGRPDRIDE